MICRRPDPPPGPPRPVPETAAASAAGCARSRPAPAAGGETPRSLRHRGAALVWVGLLALCFGCAFPGARPRPVAYENEAVRRLMDRARTVNAGLEAVKGLGRVTVVADGGQRSYEGTAWVAAEPGRLRFAFRSPTGMPVFSMSCDPQWVTALNHVEGDYHRRRVGDNSLSRFLPVAVTCADLYDLLVGRMPAVAYDTVRLDREAKADGGGVALLLQRRFRGTVGRLRLADSGDLQAVTLLDVHGNPRYEAHLEERKTVDGYRLPVRVRLEGPEGGLLVEARRLWTAAGVDASLFRIVPPRAP